MAQQLPYPDKAIQVERNLLAVLATQYYLQLLGFPSDLGDSNDLFHQWTAHAADLKVGNGRINCYPIRPNQSEIALPEIDNGLGHIIVQLSDDYQAAQLLWFAPATVRQLSSPQQLQPLDALVDCLTAEPLVELRSWLTNQMTTAWETLDRVMNPMRGPHILMASEGQERQLNTRIQQMIQGLYEQTNFSPASDDPRVNLSQLVQQLQDEELRWQAAALLWELDPYHPDSPVIRANDLVLYLGGHAAALMVGLLPRSDQRMLILARLCSIGESPTLPSNLQLIGQDMDGQQIFEVISRQQDDYMQFKFVADPGDQFKLIVRLGEAEIVENFIV